MTDDPLTDDPLKLAPRSRTPNTLALGLMSGTSLDGIDVALLRTDGQAQVERVAAATFAYPEAFRAALRQALDDARTLTDRTGRPGCLALVEAELTQRHATAALDFLASVGAAPQDVAVAGFHGQTVLHRPAATPGNPTLTVQLGDGPLLAALTGIDVAYDLRAADAAAGGQGAPLAPAYHVALAARAPELPVAILNLGGVGNLTYVPAGRPPVAFDTGPGNALIDDWVRSTTGAARDEGGELALSGTVDASVLADLLRHPYFSAPPPKSLDRNSFSMAPVAGLAAADGAATLTAFTAAAVARALAILPEPPRYWLVTGGGRHNRALMEALAERIDAAVAPIEAIGCNGDSLEAEAWAYLAVRSLAGLPLSWPGTTGVPAPLTGGVIARARAP